MPKQKPKPSIETQPSTGKLHKWDIYCPRGKGKFICEEICLSIQKSNKNCKKGCKFRIDKEV